MVSGHASPTAIYAVISTATAFAIFAVALRMYTRVSIIKRIWWDDILMAIAMAFTIVYTVCIALETHFGLGRREASLTTEQKSNRLLCFWLSVYFYQIGMGLAKVSIITQCIRVFESIRKFRIVAHILGVLVTAYTITTIFTNLFMCKPISYFWHPERQGTCLTGKPIWFFNTAFSILSDITVAALPLPVVNTLRLPKRQKYMLMAVFTLGGSVCIISIVRLYSLYAVIHNDDATWEDPQASVYSSIELLFAIIGGCLPTYNAFLARHFPGLHKRYAGADSHVPTLPSLHFSATFPAEQIDSPVQTTPRLPDMEEVAVVDNSTLGSSGNSSEAREVDIKLVLKSNDTIEKWSAKSSDRIVYP